MTQSVLGVIPRAYWKPPYELYPLLSHTLIISYFCISVLMLVKQLMPSNLDFYWLARIRPFAQRIGLANQLKLLLMRYGKPSLTVCNYAYNRIGAEAFPMISKQRIFTCHLSC